MANMYEFSIQKAFHHKYRHGINFLQKLQRENKITMQSVESIIKATDDLISTVRLSNDLTEMQLTKLIDLGACVHVSKDALLRWACVHENTDAIQLLLKVNCQFSRKILSYVYRHKNVDFYKKLCTYCPSIIPDFVRLAMQDRRCIYKPQDTLIMMLENGYDKYWQIDDDELTKIALLFRYTDSSLINYLIRTKRLDIHWQEDHLLFSYCLNNDEHGVRFLLDSGANVHAKDKVLLSKYINCNFSCFKCLPLLLQAGADVSVNNTWWNHLKKYKWNAVKQLLMYGAEIPEDLKNEYVLFNIKNDNWFAISYLCVPESITFEMINVAQCHASVHILDLLINRSVTIVRTKVQNNAGNFLVQSCRLCRLSNQKSKIEYWLKFGADVHHNDDEPLIQLLTAPFKNADEAISLLQLLLSHGANVQAQNNEPLFVVMNRVKKHSCKINEVLIKCLVSNGASLTSREGLAFGLARLKKNCSISRLLEQLSS